MRVDLVRCFEDPDLDQIDFIVSFIMGSGVNLFGDEVDQALAAGKRLRILTTDYLGVTDVSALGFLLDREGDHEGGGMLQTRIFSAGSQSFHPKAYMFSSGESRLGRGFVGSSNLSRSGIVDGIEWNLEVEDLSELRDQFDQLWSGASSQSLTRDWLAGYATRRAELRNVTNLETTGIPLEVEEAEGPPKPWEIQEEALAALVASRSEGHKAGLVVMATGLGKTWLAAFDTVRPSYSKVLFVAHREEILRQARDIFRQVIPDGRLSMYGGGALDASGDVVFATVQSLVRHLGEFQEDAFDYIVVDEFHHAAARTYRQVINHFRPEFLLGLTATPQRSDQADLLALCSDNLVYECQLSEGIRRERLSPFSYRAIRDVADYAPIPWRGGRFDDEMLTEAIATQERAEQVFEEWSYLGGIERTALAFCSSVRHADFMADFFSAKGVNARSVHSAASSAPRSESIAMLEAGEVNVLFSVDLFNEGLDVPNVDIVLMLRPTESSTLFLQQLGRGLRLREGKNLDVLDLVGNHRSFLKKLHILAGLCGYQLPSNGAVIDLLRKPDQLSELSDLPSGCSIIVETEALDLLEQLLSNADLQEAQYRQRILDWVEEHGRRPTELEGALALGRDIPGKRADGGWFNFLDNLNLLTTEEKETVVASNGLFVEMEFGSYQKSYKLLTYLALINANRLASKMNLNEVCLTSRWLLFNDPSLRFDLADATSSFADIQNPTTQEWNSYWRRNPIAALDRGDFFEADENLLKAQFTVPEGLISAFNDMAREVVEYRLHRYRRKRKSQEVGETVKLLLDDGREIDATITVETIGTCTGNIIFHAAGGSKNRPETLRNENYVLGVDLVLSRLARLSLDIADAYIETERTSHLSVAERRLSPVDHAFPIALAGLEDGELEGIRKELLRTMQRVGRAPGRAKGGGNSRKRFKLFVPGLVGLSSELAVQVLTYGQGTLPPPYDYDLGGAVAPNLISS